MLKWFLLPVVFTLGILCLNSRLGYHKLSEKERQFLESFFQTALVLPISEAELDQAISLRQRRKMTLGDAIVAGTALANDLTLVTRNTQDFKWISDLRLFNPFEEDEKV